MSATIVRVCQRGGALVVALVGSVAVLAGAAAPPVAPVKPVTDTYFGTPVTDDYRYLENLEDPQVQAWMHAQADYTRAQLDALPGHAALLERIHALSNADTRAGSFVRRGQRYFYLQIEPGAQQPKLYWREGLAGTARLLIDPATLPAASGTHHALDWFTPSWDGRYLAYGISAGGSEASTLHVLEVATGQQLAEAITRTDNSVVAWRPDNRSFFYMRFNAPRKDTPRAELMYNARTFLHRLGEHPDGEGDALVFGRGVAAAVDVPEGQGTYVLTAPDSAWAVAVANHNLDNNPSTLYVAPLAAIGGPATRWRRFAQVGDGVTQLALHGDTLYFLSQDHAARFRILATSLQHPDLAHARIVVPEQSGVITDFGIAADGLYYRESRGATSQLRRVDLDGSAAHDVPLPYAGNVFGPVTDPAQPGTLFSVQGWVRPPQLYFYDPARDASTNTAIVPPSTIDTSQLESQEVWVTSYDGTRVPLSIVYRRGMQPDGTHPTLIEGYGAYGYVFEASFWPAAVAWIERGGIWAIAHVRGGGELGEDWHRAGMMRTKPNTILDFVACSQYLIDQGYTTRHLLAANGASAGGITVGGALTWRPDLYAAILDEVGVSDTLRFETEPNGPPNVVEFGSTATEDGFHGLYAMSAYAHIRNDTDYPATLLITGANDPRVAPWHMMKMAARLQAASTSGKPVLLRIDYDAGHGIGSNRSQREQQLADEWSFALWQMGDPGFQPAAH
jgi:prolyl oligopeptidase